MKYIIAEIIKTAPANYGKTRVSFKVEGDDRKLSGFFPIAPNVGDGIDGDIVQNGEWWNFNLPKTAINKSTGNAYAPTGDLVRTEAKIDRVLAQLATIGGEITTMKSVLGDILSKVDKDMNGSQGF